MLGGGDQHRWLATENDVMRIIGMKPQKAPAPRAPATKPEVRSPHSRAKVVTIARACIAIPLSSSLATRRQLRLTAA